MPHRSTPRPASGGPDVSHLAAHGGLRGRPILVASDGGALSLAVVRVAAALAEAAGVVPHVLRGFDTRGVALPVPLPRMIAAADALIGPAVHEADARAVSDQLAEIVPAAGAWPVHLGIGTPAGLIVRTAAELGAALIVMGLRRHGLADRLLHDESTLNVVRVATCPVLAVSGATTEPPRQIVVGVDFGPACMRAAREAVALLPEGGTIVLTHVERERRRDAGEVDEPLPGWGYASDARVALDRFATELDTAAHVTVRQVVVEYEARRSVAAALRRVAEQRGAACIAVGSRRHDLLDRVRLGSVTSDLVRDGRRSVLAVPPAAAAHAANTGA